MYTIRIYVEGEGVLAADRAGSVAEAKVKAIGLVLEWREDGARAEIRGPEGYLEIVGP
jgi:hypothetical protein